jgi:hypothetical protein
LLEKVDEDDDLDVGETPEAEKPVLPMTTGGGGGRPTPGGMGTGGG